MLEDQMRRSAEKNNDQQAQMRRITDQKHDQQAREDLQLAYEKKVWTWTGGILGLFLLFLAIR